MSQNSNPTTNDRSADRILAKRMNDMLTDVRLVPYALSERRAILCFHASREYREGVTLDLYGSIEEWEDGGCRAWRALKMELDCRQQLREIRRYRRSLARKTGVQLTLEDAAWAWIPKYAAQWRERWEQSLESTPLPFPFFFFNFFGEETTQSSRRAS